MVTPRDLLIYYAHKHLGVWNEIYKAIKTKEMFKTEDVKAIVENMPYKAITLFDKEYPEILKNIYHPPLVLFYYGDISLLDSSRRKLAVVGSRECTSKGKEITRRLVEGVTPEYIIVSGMAEGIDSEAHLASMENGGRTVAVLGTGIDYCFPPDNIYLYKELKDKQLVISEYPGNLFPATGSFPQRNRIIAGLASGVLLTEAKLKSGTMITATFALQYGIDVMCVPYFPDEESDLRILPPS